jgi:hypothetical protein
MNAWTRLRALFAPAPAAPSNAIWHGEIERLRLLREQRIRLSTPKEFLRLPVKEM